jgi:hypothetical protein
MKRFVAIMAVAAMVIAASCERYEDGRPSQDVRSEFARMYPDAWDVEWERAAGGNWEVSFETGSRPDGTDRKALYDKNGNWIQTVTDVLLADVPSDIQTYLQTSEYGGASFEDNDAEYFETRTDEDFYRFDLISGGREMKVDVYPSGKVTPASYGYF